jgi:hypothetical protein
MKTTIFVQIGLFLLISACSLAPAAPPPQLTAAAEIAAAETLAAAPTRTATNTATLAPTLANTSTPSQASTLEPGVFQFLVTLSNGEPVQGLWVLAIHSSEDLEKVDASTDESGRVTSGLLLPGEYAITLTWSEFSVTPPVRGGLHSYWQLPETDTLAAGGTTTLEIVFSCE